MEHQQDNIHVIIVWLGFTQTDIALNALKGNVLKKNKNDYGALNGVAVSVFAKKNSKSSRI